MTSPTYTYEARLLLCASCGAPLPAAPEGGLTRCAYCGSSNEVRRAERAPFIAPQGPAPDEATRLANLRAQIGREIVPPGGLAPLLENNQIPAWRTQEALAVWQSARKRSADGDLSAAEELVYLTLLLARQLDAPADVARQRGMLESALDALSLSRHRTTIASALARGAAREGNAADARRWLALCDPRSEDLEADGGFRTASALSALLSGEPMGVFATLPDSSVPIAEPLWPLAAVLRAEAYSRLGDRTAAIFELRKSWSSRNAMVHAGNRYLAVGLDRYLFDEATAQVRGFEAASNARLRAESRRLLWRALATAILAGAFVAWRSPHAQFGFDFSYAHAEGALCSIAALVGVVAMLVAFVALMAGLIATRLR